MASMVFFVDSETLSAKPQTYDLIATIEEKKSIVKRLDLLSLEQLDAHLNLTKKERVHLTGKIIAEVTQQCVRTLVPLPQHLEIKVDECFLPASTEEELLNLNLEELVEPMEGNILDLGEIVIQLLSLNLDPYPVARGSMPLEYHEYKKGGSSFDVLKKKE
jgi:uncharacterized metal-binding protein YceD (DUF177 family)